jgi:hypothetical protein
MRTVSCPPVYKSDLFRVVSVEWGHDTKRDLIHFLSKFLFMTVSIVMFAVKFNLNNYFYINLNTIKVD